MALRLGDSAQAHLVTRQMSHSDSQYYQAIVGDRHAASAYDSMKKLRKEGADKQVLSGDSPAPAAQESSVQPRKPFSPEETRLVRDFFEGNLVKKQSVSLSECKAFPKQKSTSKIAKRQGEDFVEGHRLSHPPVSPLL